MGWWHQITNVGLSECEVMDDTCYVGQVSPYFCTNLAVHIYASGNAIVLSRPTYHWGPARPSNAAHAPVRV